MFILFLKVLFFIIAAFWLMQIGWFLGRKAMTLDLEHKGMCFEHPKQYYCNKVIDVSNNNEGV